MSYAIRATPRARLQTMEAVFWYEDKEPGLGGKFLADVRAAYAKITENPRRFRRVIPNREARVVRLERFDAYAIYFGIRGKNIVVYSVFHASRHPRRLRHRF
jgi:plasmid stabilization system protein ParE